MDDENSKKYNYDWHYKNHIPVNNNVSHHINPEIFLQAMLEVAVKQSKNADAKRMLEEIGIKC